MMFVEKNCGEIHVDTEKLWKKMSSWLGNRANLTTSLLTQCVTSVYNTYTHEQTVYNPLRAKRPLAQSRTSQLAE